MDISDINKIVNRRRLDAEVQKLRERVCHETTNVIRLKVNQDAAFWDLKEKLHQMESNHEKLQQNMLEVQMQHETISSQYQEELRVRPEILNKFNCTREMCDVLLTYNDRLRESMSRYKTDYESLFQAFKSSGQEIQEIITAQQQSQERNKQRVQDLQEKLKLMTETQNSLHQIFNESKQQMNSELASTRKALNEAQIKRDEMFNSLHDAYRQLDQCKFQMEKKDDINLSLQNKMEQLLKEFNTETTKLQDSIAQQKTETKQIIESNESLQKALSNQEAFTKIVSDKNLELLDNIASLTEQNSTLRDGVKDLEKSIQDASVKITNLERDKVLLIAENDELKKSIEDKCLLLSNAQKEIEELNSKLHKIDMENSEINMQLNNNIKESDSKSVKIQELIGLVTVLEKNIQKLEDECKVNRETFEEQTKQMTLIIENKDKELNSKTEAVSELISEVKNSTDVRALLETNIQKLKEKMETEKVNAKERENKLEVLVERLKANVNEKDDQLRRQMQELLTSMAEKERLQDKIQAMQNKIDNVQKELIGRDIPKTREQAEQDDNAMTSPIRRDLSQMQKPTVPPPSNIAKPPVSKAQNMDVFLLPIFNDSSDYGDSVDSALVNSRFEAMQRGERLPPAPISAIKRRRPRPPTPVPGLQCTADLQNLAQPAQVKKDSIKEKRFFKSKRDDNKKKKY